MGRDSSIFVRQSVHDVLETLLIAIVLVVIIIFLFSVTDYCNTTINRYPGFADRHFFRMYIAGHSINVDLWGLSWPLGLLLTTDCGNRKRFLNVLNGV